MKAGAPDSAREPGYPQPTLRYSGCAVRAAPAPPGIRLFFRASDGPPSDERPSRGVEETWTTVLYGR